jgi:hypothetical protein
MLRILTKNRSFLYRSRAVVKLLRLLQQENGSIEKKLKSNNNENNNKFHPPILPFGCNKLHK